MQATAAHVPNAQLRLPEKLTLNSEIPRPCFRALERLALRGHYQRYAGGPARSGVIYCAKRYAGVRLEGRISAEEDRIAYAQASKEACPAGANHGLVVNLVGHAQARLEVAPLDIGVMIGYTAKQVVVQRRRGFRYAPNGGSREPASRNDHSIVELIYRRRSGDEAGLGINRHCFIRIVKARIESDHVCPDRMIGHIDGVTQAVVDGQILPGLPGVLCEALIHIRPKYGVGAVPNFRVGIE